jgi:hypothetical protein
VADVKSDAKKEFLGQPVWIWAVAAAAAIAAGIYLYRRNAANQAATAAEAAAPAGGAADSGTSSLYGWMLDNQASPAGTTTTTTTPAQPGTVTEPISGPPGVANQNQQPSYWTQAIEALKARGVEHPTNAQIGAERNKIRKSVGLKPLKA